MIATCMRTLTFTSIQLLSKILYNTESTDKIRDIKFDIKTILLNKIKYCISHFLDHDGHYIRCNGRECPSVKMDRSNAKYSSQSVSTIVYDHTFDSAIMKCGIALSNGHWLFEHNIELQKLTWQWYPKSTSLGVPDELSNVTLHVWATAKLEDIATLAQPHFQATISLNDDRPFNEDVGFPRGDWLVFKLIGSGPALGVRPSLSIRVL